MTDKLKQTKLAEFAQQITTSDGALGNPLEGWRWFIDGGYVVLEPRDRLVSFRDMAFLWNVGTTDIEAVFRATPSPGVYLRFKLAAHNSGMTPIEQIAVWFEEQAAKERELLDSGKCNNPALTQERWMVYKASAGCVREGAWRKKP
jgi:hypothetical protein